MNESGRVTDIPREEYMSPGHMACQGCGAALAMRLLLKGLGPQTVLVVPACCWSIINGPWHSSAVAVPFLHTAFETGASAAAGVSAAFAIRGIRATVVAWAGDGGTFDIGLQALSGAAERGDDLLYVCYDNEAYMNTGNQRSSATPVGAWTTTTPMPRVKRRPKKAILEIMAAHRIPYAASASVGYPEDLIAKVRRARALEGTRFLHILAPCPPGWRILPEQTLHLARLAVETRIFPLVEVEDGARVRITVLPKDQTPVARYLEAQGRFQHLTADEIAAIQSSVDASWAALWTKAAQAGNGDSVAGEEGSRSRT
ncbi:MAG: thiamine pyrophosphate-dependent enzyme [Candidatus Methylomirabilota bacterium]|jgi:pyruvate ferredoxin oxidoreductase beta subunit/2-oxoisovalerate ferredoxin oxidoreductase beta subunit